MKTLSPRTATAATSAQTRTIAAVAGQTSNPMRVVIGNRAIRTMDGSDSRLQSDAVGKKRPTLSSARFRVIRIVTAVNSIQTQGGRGVMPRPFL